MKTPLARLMIDAIIKYEFRTPTRQDDPDIYLRALIQHVATRDLAAAHELRVGKPQADWTPEDVRSFSDHVTVPNRTKREFAPDEHHVFRGITASGFAVTEASLRDIATKGLDAFREDREEDAGAELPIMASVLLLTGDLMTMTVGRENRIAVLKHLAQSVPVFGYVLVFDAFIHSILEQKATKTDALLAQVGTRDLRLTMQRPYHFVKGRAVFVDPPPADVDLRGLHKVDDPYAEIFVSVPSPETPQ